MKQSLMKLLLCVLMSVSLTLSAQSKRDNILKVYNWADYLDLDLIDEFQDWYEKQTGEAVRVIYQTFDINENMLTEIEVGQEDYDVVCPSEYIIERMLKRNLLQKIDTTDFARTGTENNLGNVSPWAKEMFEQMSETETVSDYTVGYMWGTTGFLYNRNFVSDEEVQSWTALHNPRFQQQIYVKDAFRDIYSVLICAARYEEIKNSQVRRNDLAVNLSDENIKAVEDFLMAAKPQIAGWEADFGKERMCQGKVWLNATWSGDAQWAIDEQDEGVDLAYVVPEEGSNAWFDGWVIPVYAQNTRAASYWINFLCSSENAVRNMEATGYVSVIGTSEVLEQMIDEECDTLDVSYFFGDEAKAVPINHVYYPDQSVIDRCVLMHDTADRNEAMLEMWSRVKGNNLDWKMISFILIVFALLAFVMINRKYRIYRRRKLRRERLAKLTAILSFLFLIPSMAFAQEESEDGFEVSAELVSNYNWRGIECGGLSLQPNLNYTKGNLSIDAWLSLGADSWDYEDFLKEIDITAAYTIGHFEVGAIYYYYFYNNPFQFNKTNEGGAQWEATLKYTLSEQYPLTIFVATVLGGDDVWYNDDDKAKRAYSTYIELGYEWSWEQPGLTLTANAAVTPWKGQYTYFDKSGLCNLSARLDKAFTFKDTDMTVFANQMYNVVNDDMLWCVGLGVTF